MISKSRMNLNAELLCKKRLPKAESIDMPEGWKKTNTLVSRADYKWKRTGFSNVYMASIAGKTII